MINAQEDPGPDFTIWGDLRFQAFTRPHKGAVEQIAQLLCFADVSYKNDWYQNVLLLSLNISGVKFEEWEVWANYPHFLPFMIPCPGFRQCMIGQLTAYLENIPLADLNKPALNGGITQYVNDLKMFDETRALLGQARNQVECLQRKLTNASPEDREKTARTTFHILEALEVAPMTQKPFAHKGPLV